MQIQNLASKMTSEVAHQSTSQISILGSSEMMLIFWGISDFGNFFYNHYFH